MIQYDYTGIYNVIKQVALIGSLLYIVSMVLLLLVRRK